MTYKPGGREWAIKNKFDENKIFLLLFITFPFS